MQRLTLTTPGQFMLEEVPDPPAPDPGEVQVRVHRVGVCGTDLHAYRGQQPFFTYPRLLGHELGVEVLRIGPGTDTALRPGDRCAVEPYLNCGHCAACQRGRSNCCANLRVLGVHQDGGMQSLLNVPAEKLHRANGLSFEALALVETLAIGFHAVERVEHTLNDGQPHDVLVVGAGPIGLSVLDALHVAGVRCVVADVAPARLAFCATHPAVSATLVADEELRNALNATFGGRLPDVIFDATGNRASMLRCLELAEQGGHIVFVGLFQGDLQFADPLFHRKELTLLASRNALPATFQRIISLLETGHLDTGRWITHRATLQDAPAHFPHWLDPANGVIKAMLTLDT